MTGVTVWPRVMEWLPFCCGVGFLMLLPAGSVTFECCGYMFHCSDPVSRLPTSESPLCCATSFNLDFLLCKMGIMTLPFYLGLLKGLNTCAANSNLFKYQLSL